GIRDLIVTGVQTCALPISPITGPLASYGKIQSIIVKLAVDDINAKGGVNGSLVQLDVGDSQTDPGQAVLLFRRYAGEGFFGAIEIGRASCRESVEVSVVAV